MKFRKIAYECAKQFEISHNFNKKASVQDQIGLKDFLVLVNINRIEGFKKEEVHIFNMDEAEVSTIEVPGKVLVKQL